MFHQWESLQNVGQNSSRSVFSHYLPVGFLWKCQADASHLNIQWNICLIVRSVAELFKVKLCLILHYLQCYFVTNRWQHCSLQSLTVGWLWTLWRLSKLGTFKASFLHSSLTILYTVVTLLSVQVSRVKMYPCRYCMRHICTVSGWCPVAPFYSRVADL